MLDDLEAQVESAGAIVRVGDLPTIEADALQMRQLMQNLISNALKFRRPGVTPEVDIEATVKDERVELTVSDNGIGFEPHYATASSASSSGCTGAANTREPASGSRCAARSPSDTAAR